ncbi:hemoglobin/transferrin/lactoferrin receptor protein [Cricetibacter osteomyelitidis]|uniref:Hemoglobin/transferrin/lactoferrin receptor protein n=1 Tax=Cricetibacter osteomyelitidis TaxID=1521931 RepID=A0A4R2T241_9PAST|nr:TonB-dependent receptor [Cricetibacter osteomyelitidis]TCP94864.1 hemoglobin/transferrin/lactoferrin receptor protein [Cricetibacter osteomyelitidis]
MKKSNFVLLPLAVFVAASVHAENTDGLDTIEVVSDNYSPQVANVAAKGVVKVRQATKMSDVLRGVPGVNVNGARSIVERYNIRGVSEEYLNITVDGARQEGYSFHHSGNYGIDPEILKRVDIDVGGNSIATGAGSLGGSMKFETVDASDMLEDGENFGGKVKYGWGSNGNSHQTTAMLFGRAGNLDLLGYFNYRNQKDGENGNGLENRNKGHLQNYLFKAKYNFGENHWLKLSAEHYTNTAINCYRANMAMCLGDVPQEGQSGYKPANHGKARSEIERSTYTLGYAYNPSDNKWVNVKANAYYTETENSSMNRKQTKVETAGGTLSNRSEFDLGVTNHSVLLGGEYYKTTALRYGGKERNSQTIRPDYTQHAYSTSVYLEDAIGIGNFTITPGVRFDHFKADYISLDKTYHRFSKALGLKYGVTDSLVLFANYTELFKGPGFGELALVAPKRYTGSLEPTRGDNKEVGFNYAQDGIFANTDGFSITAKYFRTDYDNINQSVTNPANGGRGGKGGSIYASLGEVKLRGVEAQARYWIDNFGASVSYARARSEQKSNGYSAFPDSGDRYTFGLNYRVPSVNMEMGWNTMWVRGLAYAANAKSITTKDEYAVSNAYITWAPQQVKGLELTFGIDNIFDRAYKDHSTQYYGAVDLDPGRNYKLSVSYKF